MKKRKEEENESESESENSEESEDESEKNDVVNDTFSMESDESGEEKDKSNNSIGKLTSVRRSFFQQKLSFGRNKLNIGRSNIKKNTKLSQDIALVTERINFPIENFKPIPILSQQKELIYIYLQEEEHDLFLKSINKDKDFLIKEEEIKNNLKIYLPKYYKKLFLNGGKLEERLKISMTQKMKNIKPNYTIALEMDDKLKNCDTVKLQGTKKYLFQHIDIRQKGLTTFDPFSKIKIKYDNSDYKELLPKWAWSLKKETSNDNDDNDSDDEDEEEDKNIEDENTFNPKYSKRLSISKFDILHFQKLKDTKNNDEIKDEDKEAKNYDENDNKKNNLEKIMRLYKEYINNLFFPKIEDFRQDLIKYLLENKELFRTINFEKFVCLLEFFIGLFTGIQVKYCIDELGFLNMDLYANESIYMNMAEILHYQVQFQIRDISNITHHDEKINPNIIIDLNNCQYENFIKDKIEFFPPSTAFIQELSNHFRRYTHNDNYHLCQECEKLFSHNKLEKVTCDSSVFRFIDKVRLLKMTLSGVIDINYLETMIEKNSNEDSIEKNMFKATMIHRNEAVFNEFEIFHIIKSYLFPNINNHILKLNNIFRNTFGEILGYYFTWVSHYISWVIFPSIMGLIAEILIFFVNNENIQNYIYLILLIFVLLWGFYYVRDWKKYEKFYNHIWGMDSFQAEITNLYDENYSKVSYVTFLGIKIPKVDKLSALMVNIISVVLVLISSLFIMGINVGIFKIHKTENFLFRNLKKIISYIGITNEISKYMLPVLVYIVREIISKIFYNISAILAKLERPTDKNEYDEIVIKKRLTLEFVNYYFNLYYIMFYKKMTNKCENGDCFQELRKQLALILISNICSVIVQFISKIIYMRKNQKNFEIKNNQAYERNSDVIEKLKFYSRELFTEDNIQQLIIPIIFNFGYVIQFGVCCPISFFFMLILIIFIRLTNAISMIYIYYVKTLNISKGLSVYNNTQNLIVYVGLFSNLSLLFYTKNSSSELNLLHKLIIIVMIQNGIIIICNIIRFKSLPFWFRYRKIIKLKYLEKFGVIQNKNNEKKEKKIDKRVSIFKFT